MEFYIANYKKEKINHLDAIQGGVQIQTKLYELYERVPRSSHFSIKTYIDDDNLHNLKVKINAENFQLKYEGKKTSVNDVFDEGLADIDEQIVSWSKARFS